MTRWITFHPNTAATLRSCLAQKSVFEFPGRDALEYALSTPGNLVAVLKANGKAEDQCAIAVFRHAALDEAIPAKPRTVRAGGILGLIDEAVFEEEEAPRPKSWLRRIWED